MVYRIYVEKKPGFDVEAQGLKNALVSLLGIQSLSGLRLLNRYDVEGLSLIHILSATKLIAVRDPRGYRPLCIGTLPGGGYVFASESCALDAAGRVPMHRGR